MDIGTIPEKREKLSAIPLNLYRLEYTSYSQYHKSFLLLENRQEIVPKIFELNQCQTTFFHYVGEYEPVKRNHKILETDGYLVTYLMYNEPGEYFSSLSDSKKAFEEAKKNVHPSIEKLTLNRYRLIKEWRDCFVQPFSFDLKYFKPEYLKTL